MPETHIPPPSSLWAAVLADELARLGVRSVVVAPGSRSTPLALAFAADARFRTFSLLDERGAAFFALGIGLESGRPAAVLCTSGTAAANFFPAIVEADQAQVPLVVLTADRPPELRTTGANQTIDQVGLYGRTVRFARDLLPPASETAALQLRYLRTTVDRAVAAARGPVPGPVHLNVPFRKPLEPSAGMGPAEPLEGRAGQEPFTRILTQKPALALPAIDLPARGLILAGPRCPDGDFPDALTDLAQRYSLPVVADALSGLRFGPWTDALNPLNPEVCRGIASGRLPQPGFVLQFGAIPSSAAALDMLAALPADVLRISVQSSGVWQDDAHGLTHLLTADPAEFCRGLAALALGSPADTAYRAMLEEEDHRYWAAVAAADAPDFEGGAVADVVETLPEGSLLFVANSLSVRHLDAYVRPSLRRLRAFCNRGVSGIDGTISTALGVAASAGERITLILGDLAFYHDLNGLLALQRCGAVATIVILHNDGGGIFRRLPVAAHEPPFTDLFLTPHGLDFEPAARMFGASFARVQDRAGLKTALAAAAQSPEAAIIEFKSDSARTEEIRRRIDKER